MCVDTRGVRTMCVINMKSEFWAQFGALATTHNVLHVQPGIHPWRVPRTWQELLCVRECMCADERGVCMCMDSYGWLATNMYMDACRFMKVE